ncbi:hypothetical protein [Clostridium guangxiense]|uniref:hypothetical protein n=1 Tax=Clostridium guangxiense TaxID=1662055 RepID=UPI001E596A89|nr:hypothetical protein [Clostridium guangxiense]MCD2347287.1 hypothetical protein [Clostridium guangxiense]
MRKLRNLIIWIIVSIIVQTGVLYYFDKYHFRNAGDVTYKVVKSTEKKDEVISVSIPKDAKNITTSYTGKYAYYYSGSSIYVVNMLTGKSNAIKLGVDIDNVCIDWSSTSDSLLMLELDPDNLFFKVYTYYPDTNNKEENQDAENKARKYYLGKNSILNMKQNNLTTLIYIKSAYSKSSTKRYMSSLDITNGINQLDLPIKNIGDYYIFKAEDKLAYEDEVDKKVYISKQQSKGDVETQKVQISGVDNYKLISVYDKYIYVGNLVDGKIDTIYYASIASQNLGNDNQSSNSKYSNIKSSDILPNRENKSDDFTADWQEIKLRKPIDPKFISISTNTGDMHIIDNLRGTVENIKTKKKTQFDGQYVGMSDDDVVSFNSDKGKLIETKLK